METIARSSVPFEEDRLWIESIRPWLVAHSVQGNALDVSHYVATEMLNNVRDHSDSPNVEVLGAVNPHEFVLHVVDSGVGLFQRLSTGLGLTGPREAVVEIAKGKRTTDPAHHTGQGIFFSSKV
jgi:glucose-6-phosphate-specific signal transduction histidine kinase